MEGPSLLLISVWGGGERLDNDPSGARYGCFLPDLTGLARCLPAPTSQNLYYRVGGINARLGTMETHTPLSIMDR